MRLLTFAVVLLITLSCAPENEATSANDRTTLVVYCGRSEALIGKTLAAFEKQNPHIELDVRYNKTPTLASQALAEKAQCPADVFWFQDSGYLGALAKAGMLDRVPARIYNRVDTRFRDPDQRWVGITGRLRVLVYNTTAVEESDLPPNLEGLSDPKWMGRIGWAPGNASFQAHLSVLRHKWGEDRTRTWMEAVKANKPKMFPKNSPQVQAAHAGEITIGWVNHYYLHKLKTEGFRAGNYSFPTDDGGNVLMVAGAGIRKGAEGRSKEGAEKLLAFLLSDEVQSNLTKETYEYPVVQHIEAHPDLQPLGSIALSEVDQAHLTDIGPTLSLLRDLELQ